MKRIEYKTIDKSDWGAGPWQSEPDKIQWRDEATGLPCLMVRARSHWCGYAGVPASHPDYGKGYDDVPVDVHGGLTFADKCRPGAEDHSVCHVVEEGEDDNVWWLGFDCAHGGDMCPGRPGFPQFGEEVYRDQAYVADQVANLAAQLKSRATP